MQHRWELLPILSICIFLAICIVFCICIYFQENLKYKRTEKALDKIHSELSNKYNTNNFYTVKLDDKASVAYIIVKHKTCTSVEFVDDMKIVAYVKAKNIFYDNSKILTDKDFAKIKGYIGQYV